MGNITHEVEGIHRGMHVVRDIQAEFPDAADRLSEVWNLLLDYRHLVLKSFVANKMMTEFGMMQELERAMAAAMVTASSDKIANFPGRAA